MSFTPGAGTRFLLSTDSSGTISPSGPLSITGGTATTNTPVLSATQTWNNAAVTFTGWQLNVTDTASNAASLLMNLQVGGASRFSVTKTGFLSIPATSGSSGLTFDASLSRLTLDTDGTGGFFRVLAYGNTVGEIRTPAPYTDFWFNVPTGNAFAWAINNLEAMRFNATGLGIGTTSPVGKLDTRGTAYLGSDSNNSLVVDSTSSTVTIAAAGRTAFSTSALRFLTSDGTAALERMRIDSAGNFLIGTTSASDNTATYKQVISLPSGDVAGGGFMVSSNQNSNGGKALISATNYATLTGSFTKPSIYSYSRATAAYAANFQNPGANLIANVEVASNNLSFINKQAYIQHTQINSTTGRYLNNDAYLYVQRNSGTVNVNEYVAYSSSYQTAVGNETIGAFVDFNAAPFRGMSAGSLVTARYGVLIDFAATDVTNPWGVYQSNASVRNYFAGGAIFSGAALATNATNGFVYVPTCAGTPTGTPTTYTGTAPIVIDTTNNKLYFYSGGQWRDAGP